MNVQQRYPEPFIAPMRAELSRLGFEDLKTPEAVDAAVQQAGTTMIVVNSVCGCAAGKARPGIALALSKGKRPDHLATVFAGADVEATVADGPFVHDSRLGSRRSVRAEKAEVQRVQAGHQCQGDGEGGASECWKAEPVQSSRQCAHRPLLL